MFDENGLALLMEGPGALERLADLTCASEDGTDYCEPYLFEIPEKGAAIAHFSPASKRSQGKSGLFL